MKIAIQCNVYKLREIVSVYCCLFMLKVKEIQCHL